MHASEQSLQAIEVMLELPQYRKFQDHLLSLAGRDVPLEVNEFLFVLHSAQELHSATKTPTLALVIRNYCI